MLEYHQSSIGELELYLSLSHKTQSKKYETYFLVVCLPIKNLRIKRKQNDHLIVKTGRNKLAHKNYIMIVFEAPIAIAIRTC